MVFDLLKKANIALGKEVGVRVLLHAFVIFTIYACVALHEFE